MPTRIRNYINNLRFKFYLLRNNIVLNNKNDNDTITDSDKAVIFLVDSRLIDKFTCFHYTLEETQSFKNIDKIVITIDKKVKESDVISKLVDNVIYYDLDNYENLKKMKGNHIYTHFQRSFINNITYLKLLSFKDLGYKQHLFLDCDMLCLKNLDNIFDYGVGVDLAAAPTIPNSFYENNSIEDSAYFNEVRDSFLDYASRSEYNSSINSGVMLIGNRLLGEQIFESLAKLGQVSSFKSDQELIYRFLQLHDKTTFKYLPLWFNITRPTYDYFGKEVFLKDKSNISILHFSGKKPWQKDPKEYTHIDKYWYKTYESAKKYYDINE